jgi:hypothetical protein
VAIAAIVNKNLLGLVMADGSILAYYHALFGGGPDLRPARPSLPKHSERVLQGEPGSSADSPLAVDDSEQIGGIPGHTRISEHRVVCDVKELRTELKSLSFREACVLDDRNIEINLTGTLYDPQSGVAESSGRWRHPSRDSTPPEDRIPP